VAIWAYSLMPNHVHLIAVPAAFDSLHRGIADGRRRCTYRRSSASAHLAGHDDLLARVQPLLDRMPNSRDFLDNAPDSAETKAIQAHARSGRPLGDDAVLDRVDKMLNRPLRPGEPAPKPRGERSYVFCPRNSQIHHPASKRRPLVRRVSTTLRHQPQRD
jgi:putative transposase